MGRQTLCIVTISGGLIVILAGFVIIKMLRFCSWYVSGVRDMNFPEMKIFVLLTIVPWDTWYHFMSVWTNPNLAYYISATLIWYLSHLWSTSFMPSSVLSICCTEVTFIANLLFMNSYTGGTTSYPDSDTDSFFTDSTFSSDDDVSEEAEGDAAVGSPADAHWKHSVYFHGYLLVKVMLYSDWLRVSFLFTKPLSM